MTNVASVLNRTATNYTRNWCVLSLLSRLLLSRRCTASSLIPKAEADHGQALTQNEGCAAGTYCTSTEEGVEGIGPRCRPLVTSLNSRQERRKLPPELGISEMSKLVILSRITVTDKSHELETAVSSGFWDTDLIPTVACSDAYSCLIRLGVCMGILLPASMPGQRAHRPACRMEARPRGYNAATEPSGGVAETHQVPRESLAPACILLIVQRGHDFADDAWRILCPLKRLHSRLHSRSTDDWAFVLLAWT